MGASTVTYYKCDGPNCGKVLSDPKSGIVINGYITPAGEVTNKLTVLAGSANQITTAPCQRSYCWKCFHDLVSDPLLEEARQEASRPTYQDPYPEVDYDPYPRTGNKGPTGPLPPPELPPELPHYITVAANIAGIRRE